MRQILIAVGIALAVSILLTPVLIRLFTRQGFGHEIREDGPPSHHKKRGTPSMGGVAIVAGIWASYFGTHLVGVLIDGKGPSASGLLVLGLATALGAVGFLDPQRHVRFHLAQQPRPQVPSGDKLTNLPGQRRGVGSEDHREGGFIDSKPRQGCGIQRVGDRVTDGRFFKTLHGNDVTGAGLGNGASSEFVEEFNAGDCSDRRGTTLGRNRVAPHRVDLRDNRHAQPWVGFCDGYLSTGRFELPTMEEHSVHLREPWTPKGCGRMRPMVKEGGRRAPLGF